MSNSRRQDEDTWPRDGGLAEAVGPLEVVRPVRGLSLGLRLALFTTAVVTLVMGGVSFAQLSVQRQTERSAREALMRYSLTPLSSAVERAGSSEQVERLLLEAHRSYARAGYPAHHLALYGEGGDLLFSTFDGTHAPPNDTLQASTTVRSEAFAGEPRTLMVWGDAPDAVVAGRASWQLWGLHLAATIIAIVVFLLIAVRHLVTKPLERLLEGIQKMEMGYWGELVSPRGAREIRWLARRFRNMGIELRKTVQNLVSAERRALANATPSLDGSSAGRIRKPAEPGSTLDAVVSPSLELSKRCDLLRSMDPNDPAARTLARRVWEEDAVVAGRLGDLMLRARLENASLRVLEPEAFRRLEKELLPLRRRLKSWAESRRADIYEALEQHRVPFVGIQHRVKHTAGVWRKMQSKGLALEQIHDLFAFRVVVPTESDCYRALGVVHRLFEPVVGRFRDYIVNPKPNGYQSLHTRVRSADGPVFEVQLRSNAMQLHAENGPAAHWLYKQERPAGKRFRTRSRSRFRAIWDAVRRPTATPAPRHDRETERGRPARS